ncbi:hypothetical protein [Peribacillus butanolivorans]
MWALLPIVAGGTDRRHPRIRGGAGRVRRAGFVCPGIAGVG